MFDIEACLKRINYQGAREPSLETLAELQLAFVRAVPFENLDIHLDRVIELAPEKIYRKIVEDRRGGFCYECNSLFYELLVAIGFEVSYLAAAMQLVTSMKRDFEHMALLVQIGNVEYLVDVGNGQSCLQPLALGEAQIVSWENIEYRVDEHGERFALYFRAQGEDWKPRYTFSTKACDLEDYAELCHLNQTLPTALFTQNTIVTIARENGRVNLVGRELEVIQLGQGEKSQLASNEDYKLALQDHFDIHLRDIPGQW